MKAVIQRVTEASVKVNEKITGKIGVGVLVLVGFGKEESLEEMQWIVKKIIGMRIFNDSEGVMNLSVEDIEGNILVVSQFTLMASTQKGNRPSYIHAAPPDIAKVYYEQFLELLQDSFEPTIQKGIFGADMKVELLNDGPVTIWLDSKNKV